MHGNDIVPSLDRLLDQYEDIGGPETYGPEGTAIILAIWRKSKKLGWRESFQLTNTELTVQTGIKSREAINNHRKKLASDGLIGYTQPPRGTPRGDYTIVFELPGIQKAVRKMDNLTDNLGEPVHNTDHFEPEKAEPVRKMDNLTDTVLKDLDLTITTTTKPPIIQLIEAYCKLHNKIEFNLNTKERDLMFKFVEQIPIALIIKTMHQIHKERSADTNITSFLYYQNPINQAWETVKAITDGVSIPSGVPVSTVPLGEDSITSRVPSPIVALGSPRRNRPQQELDELRRKGREARQGGQG